MNIVTDSAADLTAADIAAYGLTVAIPMLLLYRLLQDRTNKLVLEMEEDAMGIVNLLEDGRRAAKSRSAAPAAEAGA